jgi:hypothetical protein
MNYFERTSKRHRTIARRLFPIIMPPKKKTKKDDVWMHSMGKKMLTEDVRAGRIPESMHWKAVFRLREEFAVGDTLAEAERLFYSHYRAVQSSVKYNNQRAATELSLLQQDRAVRPAPSTNIRGEPRWEGSGVQKLLKQDVASGNHD